MPFQRLGDAIGLLPCRRVIRTRLREQRFERLASELQAVVGNVEEVDQEASSR